MSTVLSVHDTHSIKCTRPLFLCEGEKSNVASYGNQA